MHPHQSRRTVMRATGAAGLLSTLRLPPAAAMTSDAVGSGGDEDQSISFDGGGGHLLVANDGAFDRKEGAVTVEWWQFLDLGDRDLSTWFPQVLDLGVTDVTTSGQLGVHLDGRTADGLQVEIGDGHLFTFPLGVAALDGGWVHLAIVRNGANLRAYRDGTLLGSYDDLTAMPVTSSGAPRHRDRSAGDRLARHPRTVELLGAHRGPAHLARRAVHRSGLHPAERRTDRRRGHAAAAGRRRSLP